jgi:hypothetical protein
MRMIFGLYNDALSTENVTERWIPKHVSTMVMVHFKALPSDLALGAE